MGQSFKVDDTNDIEKIFTKILKKHFKELTVLNFLYVFRKNPTYDDGKVIAAEVFKLPVRDRDMWGYDVRVEAYSEYWEQATTKLKYRIAFHELSHIGLIYDNENEEDEESGEVSANNNPIVKEDKEGRIMFELLPHDLNLLRFEAELKKYGLNEEEDDMRLFLNKVHKHFKNKKVKKEKK